MNIGFRLKELRERNALTQEEVGKSIGVTKATVNRYETGEIDIKRTIAIKLGDLFDVSPAYIMGWTDNSQTAINNNGVIGDVSGGAVSIKNGHERALTTQEQDLIRIYNKANGKQQMKIMNFVYAIEDEIDET